MPQLRYHTPHGITVTRTETKLAFSRGLGHILKQLDNKRGAYFLPATNTRNVIHVGMWPRWHRLSKLWVMIERWPLNALNERGRVILRLLDPLVDRHPIGIANRRAPTHSHLRLKPLADRFPKKNAANSPRRFHWCACW